MNKKVLLVILVVVVVGIGAYALLGNKFSPVSQTTVFDPLNAAYLVDGQMVRLVNGKAETTTIFGQPVSGDLNNDGREDAALMLVQNPGGSGTFYYVAAAINGAYEADGAQGMNAVLLGDRIAPQNIEIKNGRIIANYAERKPGEPMTTAPSVGVSKYFVYDGSMLRPAQ